MDDYVFVYMTTGTVEEARVIGRRLVEERLAACANILPAMESIYRWQGEIETAREAVLVAKTRAVLADQLAARVRELHSYDCPCVVALPIVAGNPAYLRWLGEQTTDPQGSAFA
ncbi:MAG: divalent-cation tolerance protein CutA [Reyranellaceae bacterium]